MRTALTILVLLLIIGGASLFVVYVFSPSPAEVVVSYMDHLQHERFDLLAAMHHRDHPHQSVEKMEATFEQFREAFGLSTMEVTDFALVDESLHQASYTMQVNYTSEMFEPRQTTVDIQLGREGLFRWRVVEAGVLPFPEYGLHAEYLRSPVVPERGSIYDRHGVMLAGPGSIIRIGVQPDRIEDPEQLHSILQETLGLRPEYVQQQYRAPNVAGHWFVPLISVTEDVYTQLDPILRPVPGIFFQRRESRVYPGGEFTGHVTGYLGEVTAQLIADHPERGYQAGERAGRSGLELSQEELLRGQQGYLFAVRSPGEAATVLDEMPMVEGKDLHLTLDLSMQQLAMETLGDLRGAFVVVDAHSGEILVLLSVPGYNPNEFSIGISAQRWEQLNQGRERFMFNRALQGVYAPGSVFKVLTAAAALDQGYFQPDSSFEDTGEFVVEGNIIRNFQRQVFADHTLEDAVVYSINTTMARVGLTVDPATLSEYFDRWNLHQRPNLSLPASAGQIGRLDRSRVAQAWTAIGQDQVLVTPYGLAALFTVFPTDGMQPVLHLVKGTASEGATEVIQPDTAQELAAMLRRTVTEGTGTAANVMGLQMFGKTGTAELDGAEPHAWFAGYVQDFFGRDLAFALLVEHGGVGGRSAAPLVGSYFSALQTQLQQEREEAAPLTLRRDL